MELSYLADARHDGNRTREGHGAGKASSLSMRSSNDPTAATSSMTSGLRSHSSARMMVALAPGTLHRAGRYEDLHKRVSCEAGTA